MQGERSMATENKIIGKFVLDGILPAPRGMPQIDVAFDIDANGIINVSAKDKGTGKEQRITITASSGLSQDEIERMVSDAERFADEDERKRQEVQTRNSAENAAYAAEKTIQDNAAAIPAELKTEVEGKIAAVRSALAQNDVPRMESTLNELQESLQKVGQAVYGGGPQPPPGSGPARRRPAASPARRLRRRRRRHGGGQLPRGVAGVAHPKPRNQDREGARRWGGRGAPSLVYRGFGKPLPARF